MKKRFLLPIAFLMVTTLSAQPLAPRSCADVCQEDALITAARSVANTFGPAYVPFFKGAEISEMRIFQKDDYGDNHRKIRKQFGKAYYEVVFTYDSTAVRFAFDYAAKVRIWKDTGEPLDVIFGNGMGRNFLFKSFRKQTRQNKKRKKATAHSIEQVPLQTEKTPENIWKIKIE